MDSEYSKAVSFDEIYKAFRFARMGSFWKDSIIEYDLNRLYHSVKISRDLKSRKYRLKGYYKFKIQEREKIRDIQSLHITDRVHQRSLCDNIIIPVSTRSFVYDNGASQKGKGTHFSRNRLKTHMQKFYRKHGVDGYVLQVDVRKYFESIPHEYLKQRMAKCYSGEMLDDLCKIIDSYDGEKGIGLGSQVSQIFALDALDALDHFIKEVLRIKHYGRYMDDMYLIHEEKVYLQHCREHIDCFLSTICGLQMHPKKTVLFPLKNGIRFLGFHFYLTDTGGVHVKLLKVSEKRMKRKIRKMANKGVPEPEIRKTFNSWSAHAMYGDSYYTVKNMESYMNNLLEKRSEI